MDARTDSSSALWLFSSESIVIQRKIWLKLFPRKQTVPLVLLVHRGRLILIWKAGWSLVSMEQSLHIVRCATRICMCVSLGGKKDLQCHSEMDVYKKAVEWMRNQATLEGLGSLETQQTAENGVRTAELMFCNFLYDRYLAMHIADHASELFMHPH